jgi:hypothetical protein
MDIAEAVAADQLWGWPVELLDRLLVLQRLAWTGQVPIEVWRAEDASLRDGRPPVDAEEVGATLAEWVSSGQLELGPHGGLLGRMTVLANRPPSDDDLWAELTVVAERADAEGKSPLFAEVDRGRRDLIVSWLARPESEIDTASGLPRTVIAQHGSPEAALDKVSEVERQCAKLIVARRSDSTEA